MTRILLLLTAFALTNHAISLANPTFSEAVKVGSSLYVSGQLSIDPITGTMLEGDMETLTNQTLDNVQHVLHVKGYEMNQVVKTVVYLVDIRDYEAMDAAYGQRFPSQYPPARDVVVVEGLQSNGRIEISCIADKSKK